ncbi:hypothetical protein EUGRSUZ_C00359 [Eucalyptus grandis]|uniref:Uncharacterized protein n=2 Tax=Eucalyptus grandis TaxID=71139 RepID=A0ACC3L9M5_EUCGR|nr:hypothetical protein EUGRSUZ_C00359 [Eucalyptus grandis]
MANTNSCTNFPRVNHHGLISQSQLLPLRLNHRASKNQKTLLMSLHPVLTHMASDHYVEMIFNLASHSKYMIPEMKLGC